MKPNIERLTRLLREMAEQTQFIVITHAKRTMEAAQSLYGVTMQEPGVSKLVSVKFEGNARQTVRRHAELPMRRIRGGHRLKLFHAAYCANDDSQMVRLALAGRSLRSARAALRQKSFNPQVKSIVSQVSADRIADIQKKLESSERATFIPQRMIPPWDRRRARMDRGPVSQLQSEAAGFFRQTPAGKRTAQRLLRMSKSGTSWRCCLAQASRSGK